MQHQHFPQLYHAMKANHEHRKTGQGNVYITPHADNQASAPLPLKRSFKARAFAEYFIGTLKIADLTRFQQPRDLSNEE